MFEIVGYFEAAGSSAESKSGPISAI